MSPYITQLRSKYFLGRKCSNGERNSLKQTEKSNGFLVNGLNKTGLGWSCCSPRCRQSFPLQTEFCIFFVVCLVVFYFCFEAAVLKRHPKLKSRIQVK